MEKVEGLSSFQSLKVDTVAELIAKGGERHFPVTFGAVKGRGVQDNFSVYKNQFGNSAGNLLEAKIVDSKRVQHKIGNDSPASIDITLDTLEFAEPSASNSQEIKTHKITVPAIDSVDIKAFLQFAAGLTDIYEAVRNQTLILLMTNRDILDLGINQTGLLLADLLTGTSASTNAEVENAIRQMNLNRSTTEINAMIKDHQESKVAAMVKDKVATHANQAFASGLRQIVKCLEAGAPVRITQLQKTDVAPANVNHETASIKEVVDINQKVDNKYSGIL